MPLWAQAEAPTVAVAWVALVMAPGFVTWIVTIRTIRLPVSTVSAALTAVTVPVRVS